MTRVLVRRSPPSVRRAACRLRAGNLLAEYPALFLGLERTKSELTYVREH
jgi:hypothetical protein